MTQEKTVLITGSSRGIGLHLAERFLKEGFGVVGVSRSRPPLAAPGFRWIKADLGDPADVLKLRQAVAGLPLHGLINNAGIHGPIGPFAANDFGQWAAAFQVNLFGPAALTQACIPALRANRGFIIFLSGGGSAHPRPNFSAYAVSKTAVLRLSETLAKELAPEVLVYCVAPGPNRTGLLEEAIRGGEPVPEKDVVDFEAPERLCLFLARNQDPRYSGKFIHVKDPYDRWSDAQLAPEAHTLRRIKVV